MSDSRLIKLGVLLESRNRALRSEAIATLAQLAVFSYPLVCYRPILLVHYQGHGRNRKKFRRGTKN